MRNVFLRLLALLATIGLAPAASAWPEPLDVACETGHLKAPCLVKELVEATLAEAVQAIVCTSSALPDVWIGVYHGAECHQVVSVRDLVVDGGLLP